jgi:hypothetical protein
LQIIPERPETLHEWLDCHETGAQMKGGAPPISVVERRDECIWTGLTERRQHG